MSFRFGMRSIRRFCQPSPPRCSCSDAVLLQRSPLREHKLQHLLLFYNLSRSNSTAVLVQRLGAIYSKAHGKSPLIAQHCTAPSPEHCSRSALHTIRSHNTNPSKSIPWRSISNNVRPEADLYAYIGGKWLHENEKQVNARHIAFNFDALCQKAIHLCPGAREVIAIEKTDGGFNRVFLLMMDNAARIIARLPTSVAGPPRLTTNSEVATITYIKSKTSIPVPTILSWSDTSDNDIGAEHIFMTPAEDLQLQQQWEEMNPVQHLDLVRSIIDMIKQMADLELPAYGSIYFDDALLAQHRKSRFVEGFCIGPLCSSRVWNCGAGEASLYRHNNDKGPWSNVSGHLGGRMSSAYSRIPKSDDTSGPRRPYQGSVGDHLELIKDIEVTLARLVQTPALEEVSRPTLLHPDLHKRNIFVSKDDPSKISCIIDWQSTSIEPAFMYANETPDFAALPTDVISNDSPEQMLPDEESAKSKNQENIERCAQAFEVCIFGYVDILRRARAIDQTILRPFRHCTSTWRDGVPAARSDMIDLFRAWKDLGLPGECPYQPTEDEIAAYEKQYEDFKASHALKTWLSRTFEIGSEGWVPIYDWDRILPLYREAHRMWMESAKESEAEGDHDMTQEKADRLWPFDQR